MKLYLSAVLGTAGLYVTQPIITHLYAKYYLGEETIMTELPVMAR